MRPGLFPSQQRAIRRAFKKADKFDHFRTRTRRAFLAGGAAAVAVAALAFWTGSRISSPERYSEDRWAAVARGPIEELRLRAIPLLGALDGRSADDLIWLGYHRLVADAVAQPGDTPLRRMLIQVARRSTSPRAAQDALSILNQTNR